MSGENYSAIKGKKVLVCGASGFIGTNLCQRLTELGATVRAAWHTRPLRVTGVGIEPFLGDFRTEEACLSATENMDGVFICSASTAGAQVMQTDPLAHVTPNILMNTRLLDAAYKNNVERVLFLSSSAAYPPSENLPRREDDMFTGEPYYKYHAVGWMKRQAEKLCETYALHIPKPMATTIVRPGNAYGPFDKYDFDRSHMMAALQRRVVERHTPLEVWGDGSDARDLIYIDDLIEGIMRAYMHDALHYVVNIASGRTHSVREVIETLCEADNFDNADIRYDTTKPRMISKMEIDISRAQRELDFNPAHTLKDGIEKSLEWLHSELVTTKASY